MDMEKKEKQTALHSLFSFPRKRCKFYHLFIFLFFFFLAALLLHNSFGYLDPDLGWHLAAGEKIKGTGDVPRINEFNYILQDQEWVDHEWLADLGVFLVYDNGGYLILTLIFALLVIGVLLGEYCFITREFSRSRVSGTVLMLFFLWGVAAMAPQLGIRIQEFGLVFLLALVVLLHYYSRSGRRKMLLWLPLLIYFWACMHGSFLLGLFLMFAFAAIKALERWICIRWRPSFLNEKGILTAADIRSYGVVAVISGMITLFTPYGVKIYSFLADYGNTFYLSHIKEWFPQYFIPFNYAQLAYIALVTAITGLYLYYGVKLKKKEFKMDIWWLFLVSLLVVMAIGSRRHFPLLFIGSLPWVIDLLGRLGNTSNLFSVSRLKPWLQVYLVLCLMVSSLFILSRTAFTAAPFESYCDRYPCEATDFLRENSQYRDLNLLATYGWGGYLIWRYPEGRLFIDGRMPQYPLGNGVTILEEYYSFFDQEKVKTKLKEHNVEMVLIKAREVSAGGGPDPIERFVWGIEEKASDPKYGVLREYLFRSDKWENIFESETSLLFKKILTP